MQFEKLTYEDIKELQALQPFGWPDIREAFRFYCTHDYCFPIKVTIDKKAVGIGNSIMFNNTAWLAHIIVSNDFRNRGIGFQIVDFLLKEIKVKGIETSLLIATNLGEPVYKKAGFRKVSDYKYFKKESFSINQKFSQNIYSYNDKYYKEIIKLDTYISGENREKLLKEYLEKSYVYINNNSIQGFYIPNLGEGPIFAKTTEAGKELMHLKYSTIVNATIPCENKSAITFIQELGFTETPSTGTRMIFGKDIAWRPTMIFSRIGGNFG